ncbi:MAG: hypothetical protein IJ190_13565 [Prevotella sp.]|nr:hypothetical protein [Prevotella sp.]
MFTKALIGCRLQSTDLLTPVDKVADSMSTDLLTLSQQVNQHLISRRAGCVGVPIFNGSFRLA